MKEKLLVKNKLDKEMFNKIKALANICENEDDIRVPLKLEMMENRDGMMDSDYLYFYDGNLIAYLGLYIFNQKEVELTGMVHPDYRRKGIFSFLLHTAKEVCKEKGYKELLFICNQKSKSGTSFLKQQKAKYDITEYKMILDKKRFTLTNKHQLNIRKATKEDHMNRIEILRDCFGTCNHDLDLMDDELNNKDKIIYVAEYENQIIGNICMVCSDTENYIYGIGILSSFRGRGFGQEMINKIVSLYTDDTKDIILEVASENINALGLYQSIGFIKVSSYDYYRIKLADDKIRPFERKDRNVLIEMIKSMLGDDNLEEVSQQVVDDFYENDHMHVYVYDDNESIKGFGTLKFNSFEGANGVCEIVWLGINKQHRKHGYGKELVQYMENYALSKNIRKIYLKTSIKNKNAVCFWIRCNYLFESRMLDFSLPGYDDYYFGKEILKLK